MSNNNVPGSNQNVNVQVRALTIDPNVTVQYKTIILKKNLVNGVNTLTQEMMSAQNTKYVIKYDYVLGEDITVPTNCVLEFDGGSITNGVLIGNDTILIYASPFLNNTILNGSFYTSADAVLDTNIFIDSNYNTDRIRSIFNIQSAENKIVFAKNIYNNIGTISLNRDVDVDFGGSTINLHVDNTTLLPDTFILMPYKARSAENTVSFVRIKNVDIVGNPNCEYDPENPYSGFVGTGVYRRCIQIFNVDSVELDNVNISHFKSGKSGNTAPLIIDRWERPIVSIWHYINAKIDGMVIHDSHADNLIGAVPKVNDTNMLEVCRCSLYNSYTGLLVVVDGRCRVHDNNIQGTTSSVFNLFCYDSDIYNNEFNTLGNNIDLHENGTYYARNVRIYNNISNGCGGAITICGKNIFVYDNIIRNNNGQPAIICFPLTITEQQSAADVNNPLVIEHTGDYYIENNRIENSVAGGIVEYNTNAVEGFSVENVYVRNNYIDSVHYLNTNNRQPLEFKQVKNITIIGNTIYGFSRSTSSNGTKVIIDIGANNKMKDVGNLSIIANHILTPSSITAIIGDVETTINPAFICIPNADAQNPSNINLCIKDNVFEHDITWGITSDSVTLTAEGNTGMSFLDNLLNVDKNERFTVLFQTNYSCYSSDYNKYVIWNGEKWVEWDNAVAGVARSGATENRPVGSSIYVGFKYLDTTLGKPIYAYTISGDTVTWVDATGTPV